MTDQQGAIWIPNQNYFPGRNGLVPRYVIVHGTAGGTSAVAIGNFFAGTQNTANPVASHYIIGTAGEIVQTVLERDGAWGNGAYTPGHAAFWDTSVNPNNLTISIEHCKPSLDNSDVLTDIQQAVSFKLIHDICQRWKIPMHDADSSGGITGHFSLDPVNRSNCPGLYNWNALWAYLKGDSVTQAQYDDLYKKWQAVCKAYDAVVVTKNAKIAENTAQAKTIATQKLQLAALQPAAQKAAITTAITTLQKLVV